LRKNKKNCWTRDWRWEIEEFGPACAELDALVQPSDKPNVVMAALNDSHHLFGGIRRGCKTLSECPRNAAAFRMPFEGEGLGTCQPNRPISPTCKLLTSSASKGPIGAQAENSIRDDAFSRPDHEPRHTRRVHTRYKATRLASTGNASLKWQNQEALLFSSLLFLSTRLLVISPTLLKTQPLRAMQRATLPNHKRRDPSRPR
jgi:hypothetical protein